jgi:hypothetical protein
VTAKFFDGSAVVDNELKLACLEYAVFPLITCDILTRDYLKVFTSMYTNMALSCKATIDYLAALVRLNRVS